MSNYSDRKKAITEQAASNNPIRISLHSELISHIEYSVVTRFNASYLKHLGGSSNHRITNSLRRTMNDRNLTHEQLETQELLRQHLRQEGRSLPGSQENSFRRRLLNPLQRSEIERSNNNPVHSHRPLPHHVDRMPNRPNPNPSVSTISISFSPDGRTMASSHGDHSVKITCAHTGKLIRTLEGREQSIYIHFYCYIYQETNTHASDRSLVSYTRDILHLFQILALHGQSNTTLLIIES